MSLPLTIYRQRIGEFISEIDHLRKPLRWIPWLRLLMFLLTGVSLYFHFRNPGFLFISASVFFFVGFIFAGWYDNHLKKRILRLQQMIFINEQEIKALNDDYSGFDPGIEFISQDHPYTFDLDIFGQRSLYQYVNRTSTNFGSKKLADYFCQAFHYRNEISERQEAVKELADNLEFRQNFRIIFTTRKTSGSDLDAVSEWFEKRQGMHRLLSLNLLFWIVPGLTLGTLILSIAGLTPFQLPMFMILMQLLIVFGFGRKTMLVHQAVTSQVGILRMYSDALTLIENTRFSSVFNSNLQEKLKSFEKIQPGIIIRKLFRLLNLMDSNLNMLVSVILNGLFMFNIHVLIATERWRSKYRRLAPGWFDVLAEMDALSSLGTFAFNHPGYCYPEPVAGDFEFNATQIGHPLIPLDSSVQNDIEIRGWNQFRIITGANMSGKSTFLRTIGANYLLAMMGAPAFARRMVFSPVEIHSSIRTNDSLAKRESYFYAELKRLKEIIDELKTGRPMLILLDEILKGTNSADKQSGSIALIRQLLNYKLVGLFATHDLLLGTLISEFPENIQNLCFEISISDDKMEINYKLTPGVCRNLNASFLMKRMGIIFED